MTSTELANTFAPTVREAFERSKPDILASLPIFKRGLVKIFWKDAMTYGVPAELRIAIELVIGKYRELLEPSMGSVLESVKPLIDVKTHPELSVVIELIDLLNTPTSSFTSVVQECLNPNLPHDIPTSDA